ncbi:C-type lectin 21, partial [Operophtera brumata]
MTCAAEGAHLAIINSVKESQVLKELFAKYPDNLIFSSAIGFHDWGERGIQAFSTISLILNKLEDNGETLNQAGFDRFESGEPSNTTKRTGDDGEYCGSILRTGNLNDVWCDVNIPFICEKRPDSLFPDIGDY